MKTMATASLILSLVTMMKGQTLSDDQMVLLPVQNDPTVSFRVWFKAGSQDDPAGKEGLAAITASMLADASTKQNSYEQILEKLFPLAASYAASPSVEMTVISGRVHKDNLEEYYPLFIDALLAPAFKQEDLERIKSETLNYLENTLRYSSDEELGKAVLYNALFAGTPYGHITAGSVAAVKGITLGDVETFYRTHFTRNNVVVGLGGGYDRSLCDRLKRDLGRLPDGAPPTTPAPTPAPIHGFRFTIVEKNASSSAISMGVPIDVVRGTKDWYALAIANSWFGEHRNSSSHLYRVIREERGLNYGDYSYIENFPRGGSRQLPPQNVCRRKQIFEIWIRPVPNGARLFAMRAALREYKHLVSDGLTQEEFELTRRFLHNYVLHYAPSTMERLGYALDDRFYGIQGSHLAKFRSMMNQLTLADVNAAIKRHLRYGDMEIVCVTQGADSLKQAFVSGAASPISYTSPKSPAVLEEDAKISTYSLGAVKPEAVKIIEVGKLFE